MKREMKMEMKTKMKSVGVLVFASLNLISCGVQTSKGNLLSSPTSSQGGDAEKPAFLCQMAYSDKSLQATPLFTEGFYAVPQDSSVTKNFGVTPSDGLYYAAISPNSTTSQTSEIALMIGNASTGLMAVSIFKAGAESLHVMLALDANRTFQVYCTPKK
ncbi:MAG: hypothetical protein NTV34_05730 [Proteobacteria bacterium]|nr:hypothetical protein [Pseudomonadota bacterium]